jgi:hypothetical protein
VASLVGGFATYILLSSSLPDAREMREEGMGDLFLVFILMYGQLGFIASSIAAAALHNPRPEPISVKENSSTPPPPVSHNPPPTTGI